MRSHHRFFASLKELHGGFLKSPILILVIQSEAKNLECINVGVHEILRFALDDMYSVVKTKGKFSENKALNT